MPVLPVVAALLAFSLFAIVPSATYLYVEGRARRHWIEAATARQRAPFLVRVAAWWSLALGQLAIPLLVVPVTCGGVVFMLAKLGKANVSGTALLVVLAVASLVQAVFALRLFPFGIRLLARDAKVKESGARFAASFGAVQALAFGAAALNFTLLRVPGFLNPIVRTTVYYGAIVPVAVLAVLGFVLAALFARASKCLD